MGDASYCTRHARYARRLLAPHVARCPLDDWADDETRHSAHRLGPIDASCEKCVSSNFAPERIGTPAKGHLSICCQDGKTCELPPFADPTPVFKELLA